MGVLAFRTQLNTLMQQHGWGWPKLAAVTGYSRSYVFELGNGRKARPSAEVVEDLDLALDAQGLLIQAWHCAEDDAETTSVMPADALLAQIAAVARACGLLPPGSQWRHVALNDVTRLVAITDLYRSIDREHGGGALCRELAQVAEAATSWLGSRHSTVDSAARHRLASAVADVRLLAGWTAFDAGLYEDSQRHFVLAERAAVHAGEPLLAARVRYCQARQLQHRQHNIDALHTVQFARDDLGTTATPAILALLLGTEAASQAALGRREEALRCLEQASENFAEIHPEQEPSWMGFYDAGELYAQYGRVYRDLARQARADRRPHVPAPDSSDGPQAVQYVRKALGAFGSGNIRSIVLNQVSLCSSLMLADDPDQALLVGPELLSTAANMSSGRVVERIQNLRRDFGPHHRRPDVAAFARMISAQAVR